MPVEEVSIVLRRPMVDLVEAPLSEFTALLRAKVLPTDEEMAILDAMVELRVLRALRRSSDRDTLKAEVHGLHRLVPHRVRAELDRRTYPWSARITAYADLLDLAAEAGSNRDPKLARSLAHAKELIAFVTKHPGLSQAELGTAFEPPLRPANLSRILGVLEANGLVRRDAVGKEKHVYPAGSKARARRKP